MGQEWWESGKSVPMASNGQIAIVAGILNILKLALLVYRSKTGLAVRAAENIKLTDLKTKMGWQVHPPELIIIIKIYTDFHPLRTLYCCCFLLLLFSFYLLRHFLVYLKYKFGR